MSEYNIQMNKYNALNAEYDQLYPQPMKHANTHASGGTDPITPGDIGAYSKNETDALLQNKVNSSDVYTKDEVDTLFQMNIQTAVLNVTTNAGVVVTATKGSKVLSATADSSGLAVLYPDEFGTWTLKATINGKTMEVPFVIDAIAVFNTSLTTNLEDASWGLISAVAEAGNASSVWSVGATKTIKLNGVSYTAQIIGFNHDTKTAGGKAGITFQLVDCLNTTYQMNSSNTNVGGWKSSAMRSRMSEFLGQLDEDLKSVIKPVNKLVSIGNKTSTIETVSDKLFLLSEVEIFGSTTNSFSGEGSQYDWYKAGNTKVKKVNGSASDWWERSPNGSNSTHFCSVGSNGNADISSASASYGVAFGFCV